MALCRILKIAPAFHQAQYLFFQPLQLLPGIKLSSCGISLIPAKQRVTLIQPADISKYNYINLCEKDIWGVIMRKDSPLAGKKHIKKEDLLDLPLICSRQAISPHQTGNEFSDWFGDDFEKLNIVTTFNLVYNAAIMVDAGIGYAITLDNLADTSPDSNLCFRPLEPKLESGLNIIWKKYQVFSPAAELFLNKITERFA